MSVSIGDLSSRTGVKIETIRYYERIGLMPKAARTTGGHRAYDDGDVKRLTFVRRCRNLGFSVGDIGQLLHLVDGGAATCSEVKSITEVHLADVRQRLDDLRRLESALDAMVRECHGDEVPDCPILEVLSA